MEIVFRFVCVCIAFLSPQKGVGWGWGGSQGPLRHPPQTLNTNWYIYILQLDHSRIWHWILIHNYIRRSQITFLIPCQPSSKMQHQVGVGQFAMLLVLYNNSKHMLCACVKSESTLFCMIIYYRKTFIIIETVI